MKSEIEVRIADLEAFKRFVGRVKDFITEYAWHDRSCASVDVDGEWRKGNPDCDCGYDEAIGALFRDAWLERGAEQNQALGVPDAHHPGLHVSEREPSAHRRCCFGGENLE